MKRLTYDEIEAAYGVPAVTARNWMHRGVLTRAGTRPSAKGGRSHVLVADDARLRERLAQYEPRVEATVAQTEEARYGGYVLVSPEPEPRPSWWGRLVQRFRDAFASPVEVVHE